MISVVTAENKSHQHDIARNHRPRDIERLDKHGKIDTYLLVCTLFPLKGVNAHMHAKMVSSISRRVQDNGAQPLTKNPHPTTITK